MLVQVTLLTGEQPDTYSSQCAAAAACCSGAVACVLVVIFVVVACFADERSNGGGHLAVHDLIAIRRRTDARDRGRRRRGISGRGGRGAQPEPQGYRRCFRRMRSYGTRSPIQTSEFQLRD
eukprot:COSAG02_NODE_39_length_48074_cov_106.508890_5_plen_121_part_00